MGESDDHNDSVEEQGADHSERPSTAKKKRNINFSREEIKCLITEFGNRSHSLNFGTRDQKHKCWEEITFELNKINIDVVRSVTEVKKKWIDLLYETKKHYIKATKDAEKAGASKRRRLNEIAEMIIKVKGGFSKKAIENDLSANYLSSQDDEPNGTPTTFLIPHISDCNSEDEATKDAHETEDATHMIISASPVLNGANNIIATVDPYQSYADSMNNVGPTAGCGCGLGINGDLVRLKQESIGLKRRLVQIEEERRLEEKQKWWEEKTYLRLQKQKLELEIKALQANLNITKNI